MFERHIFKFLKFNILFLIKILSVCHASLPDWGVKGVFQTKTIEGTGFNSLRRGPTSSVKCSGNLWGCAVQNFSDSKSQMQCGVLVPCTAQRHSGVRQRGCVLSLILSVSSCRPHRLRRPQCSRAHFFPTHQSKRLSDQTH